MRLVRFTIENHARLEDVNLEIRSHLVLVGSNDVGKSSLLRCMDLLLGASTAALYARVSADDLRDRTQPLVLEAELDELTPAERAWFVDEPRVEPELGTRTVTVRMEVLVDDGETVQIRRFSPHGPGLRQLSRDQIAALGFKLVTATQSAARDFRDEKNAALDDILSAIDLAGEREAFQSAAEGLQRQLGESAVLRELRGQLAGQLTRAVPRVVGADDLSFVAGSIASEDLLADVRLQLAHGGEPRPIAEQSDGARALFAIALYDLVSAAANVVAIDEPEIHLHPSSQRSLARLLREGPNQKILATHSPDVVSAFSPDDVAVVRAGGKIRQPTRGFLDGEGKLTARWWVQGKLEPLTAAAVVLVEGPSDRIILERVAELTGRDLDRAGVSVVEVDGSRNMAPARKLFGPDGFDVPIQILIDEDAIEETAKTIGVDPGELVSHAVTVSAPDLEAEYVEAIGGTALWQRLVESGEFTSNQLAQVPGGRDGALTDKSVAQFCGNNRYKVLSALVVASTMTSDEAAKIASINDVLASVQRLG